MTSDRSNVSPLPPAMALRPRDRLLAEAVRALESSGVVLAGEANASDQGRDAGGELEGRIINRARLLPDAKVLHDALGSVRHVIGWVLFIAGIASAVSGAAAVRTVLGSPGDQPVNVFWVIGTLLGVQSALLLMWVIAMIILPRSARVSPLGELAVVAGRWIARKFLRTNHHAAALRALASMQLRGASGRWTVSAISHGLWAAFNLGCVALLLLVLSAKAYTFNWETTILSKDSYISITRAIAQLPAAIGFETPTDAQIEATEASSTPTALEDARTAWSWLLIGAVTVYGLAPRAILATLSFIMLARARRRFRLEVEAPEYVRLHARLLPSAVSRGVIDSDNDAANASESRAQDASATANAAGISRGMPGRNPGGGPPIILGLEIERPASNWPPPIHSVRWVDLGFIDSRDDRRRAIAELRAQPERSQLIVAVCDLVATPDRGLGAFVQAIGAEEMGPIALVLTGGQHLRERGATDQLDQRIADWHQLAARAAIPRERVIELDLDHLTDASLRKLTAFLSDDGARTAQPRERRIDQSFAIIEQQCAEWNSLPTTEQQADLHRKIAEVYRADAPHWRALMRLPETIGPDAPMQIKRSAARMIDLLPDRLKRSPKWLAAGAVTGALGCVAAAMLVSPVAIGSLPLWATIGAAISAAVQLAGRNEPNESGPDEANPERFADAVRAAALFAMVLELQGRDESAITRILDRALNSEFTERSEQPIGVQAAAAWLNELRHQFDRAVALESAR